RLRRRGLTARRLTVALDYVDYSAAERSVPLPALALDAELGEAARRALGQALTRRIAVRHVAVIVDRLITADVQLDLWQESSRPDQQRSALQRALDGVYRLQGTGHF